MRRILILMAILLALMFNPSAEAADPVAPGTSSPAISQHLDRLFAQLKLAASEQAGREIEQKIWIQWTTPDDPALADQMHQVLAARRVSDYDKALALLDAMVIAFPAYAEAWNQRATVHFLREDFEQSLADIAETLVHEPRHFGALAGRALIRMRQLKPALAIQNLKAALVFHPYLRERHMIAGLGGGGGGGVVR